MSAALRIPGMILWLTALWVALWGSITWANVLGGLVVALAIILLARRDPVPFRTAHLRPHWAVWYVVVLGWKLLLSNLRLAYEILAPGDRTYTAILAVPMRGGSETVVNLVANSITLTPGTMTIDIAEHDHDHLDDVVGREADERFAPVAETIEAGTAVAAGVTLYVHGMFARDVEAVRHDVLELEALALRAFGSREDYRRAEADVIDHVAVLDEGDRRRVRVGRGVVGARTRRERGKDVT